jgi:hypothetical protein
MNLGPSHLGGAVPFRIADALLGGRQVSIEPLEDRVAQTARLLSAKRVGEQAWRCTQSLPR